LNGELRVFGLLYILSHAQYFVLGLLLYFLTQRHPLLINNEKYKNVCGIAFCCTLAAIAITFKINQRIPEEIFLSFFGFFLVLLSVIGLPRILDNSASRWLGLISYSIYLVQFPIIQALREHGIYNHINLLVGGGVNAFIFNSMLTICLVIAISTATYYTIELPGQHLLTNLTALKKNLMQIKNRNKKQI
jgi:peptidoglycan/LPS O-acetylase OafA/YrhL